MKLFSQRKGIKPVKSVMQVDSMDDDLRNGLWDALTLFYWWKVKEKLDGSHDYGKIDILLKLLWYDYFKKPIDTLSDYWPETYGKIRKYFFSCPWFEVYDFIEFIANNYPNKNVNSEFMKFCNSVLEKEVSAYRFVGGKNCANNQRRRNFRNRRSVGNF